MSGFEAKRRSQEGSQLTSTSGVTAGRSAVAGSGYHEQAASLRPSDSAVQMNKGGSSNDSQNESGSQSDSSASGQRRSFWEKLREAASGVMEVGPIDAYDAAYGDDASAATDVQNEYSTGWEQNAARHCTWQARLTFRHGESSATSVGNAHERGSPDALDSWIDQYNNVVGRAIGNSVTSLDEIPARVRTAMSDGSLITDPNDARVPAELRPPSGS